MGANPAPARKGPAQAARFLLNEGPDIGCERSELLNGSPALVDRLQRRRRQGTLSAVVEVGLIGQCWTEIPEPTSVCVGSGAQNCHPHLQAKSVLRASTGSAIRRASDRL